MKKIFKGILGSKPWLITTSIVIVVLLVLTILSTQVLFFYNTFNSVFGEPSRVLDSGDPSQYMRFTSDHENKEKALAAANNFNEKIVEEGIILLKNEGNALPIKTPVSDNTMTAKPKVSIFGKNSVNLVYGGSGSSERDAGGSVTMRETMEKAGYEVNPTLHDFYTNNSKSGSGRPGNPAMGSIITGFPTGETPMASYDAEPAVKESYSKYNDAAVVVISRIGGEGFDVPTTMFWNNKNYTTWNNESKVPVPGAGDVNDHYLQLDNNEKALIEEVGKSFENIIIVVNCSQAMELGFIEDNPKIKAALWIGGTGKTGLNALGRVINGTVNPSGRTVDTFARDFKQDPTWFNFGNNRTGPGNQYAVRSGDKIINRSYYYVDYEEGIYVGYRYYETRGFDEKEKNPSTTWYEDNVIYPLGFGKSYTTFDYEIKGKLQLESTQLTAKSEIEVEIEVTNTGTAAGKEVVQLYMTPEFTDGEIEKSHVVLVGYAKTKLIAPLGTDTVKIKVPAYYFASYDYSDANTNGFKGYEIEKGEYILKASRNAHDVVDEVTLNQAADIKIEEDTTTGYKVENLFDDVSEGVTTYLSRYDWENTFPEPPTDEERIVTTAFLSEMEYTPDDTGKPWYTDKMPTQSKRVLGIHNTDVKLYDLIDWNKTTGEVTVDYDNVLWEDLLDQLTAKQLAIQIGTAVYRTEKIDNIQKPITISVDGPVGFNAFMGTEILGEPAVYGTCFYASGCVVAATYNVDIAYEMGVVMGNEAVIGDERGGRGSYSSWYAPAVNIHRSPFGGRNWEYYSEDGLLSGNTGAAIIKGATSKGVATYVKHFALNDQETRRCDGVSSWIGEQASREIYLRAFEICIKDGESVGVMSSFNRLGTVWTGGDYRLLTTLLRREWGFVGSVITDFNTPDLTYMKVDQMIRAGGDLSLSQDIQPSTKSDALTATQVSVMRQATKNALYTIAKSNAMNGYGDGVIYSYTMPVWLIVLLIADGVILAGLATWGVFAVRKTMKRQLEHIDIEIKT